MRGGGGSGALWRLLLRPVVPGAVVAAVLGILFASGNRAIFVPGRTSDGHHLIEGACSSCHGGFEAIKNESCAGCHRAELAQDTHSIRVFEDPRWAEDLARLDASRCITCHAEHHVAARGVTVDASFCFPCHDDVPEKRASHKGLPASSCGDAGCHNYHDNRTLNTAFLTREADKPDLVDRNGLPPFRQPTAGPAATADAPPGRGDPAIERAWLASRHREAGVSCGDCHGEGAAFVSSPGFGKCADCHGFEHETWRAGKHGVRAKAELAALGPDDARLPMKKDRKDRPAAMACGTCHDPHSVDTRRAAVEACLACHDDEHSRLFTASPHGRTVGSGPGPTGAGEVTCATCHLPRVTIDEGRGPRVVVNHNNTFTLEPVDRMAGMVCLRCHGLDLALSSLLDRDLGRRGYAGRPRERAASIRFIKDLAARSRGGG